MKQIIYLQGRPPAIDASLTGVTFVDVLFALAAGQALMALTNISEIHGVGWARFSLAMTLVMTSWVGYHMSHNKPQWEIHFVNRPLFTFLFDVTLVGLYWLMALDINGNRPVPDSAVPEALILVGVFILYGLWDSVAATIKSDARYTQAYKDYWNADMNPDLRRRRVVTGIFLVASVIVAFVTWHWGTSDPFSIGRVDVVLIALLLGYRLGKELVTPPPPTDAAPLLAPCRGASPAPTGSSPTAPGAAEPPAPHSS